MTNPLYNATGAPGFHNFGSSAAIRAEFQAIAAGFDKFPSFVGQGGRVLQVNSGETGFEYALPTTYLSQAVADSMYLKKIGDTASGAIGTLLDGVGFKGTIASSAGLTGLQLFSETAQRRLEILFFGATSAGGYGAAAGTSVINASIGGLTLSTADTARMVIDISGRVGFGAQPGSGLVKFFGNYIELVDANYHGYIGRGDVTVSGTSSADLGIVSTTPTGAIVFGNGVGSTERMRIDVAGSVGVGGGFLTFGGATFGHSVNGPTTASYVLGVAGAAAGVLYADAGQLQLTATSTRSLFLVAGGAQRLQITNTGRILFGGTTGATLADVEMPGTLGFVTQTFLSGIYGAGTSADVFTIDTNKVIHNFGLSWKLFSDALIGPTAALSGFGGIRLFTQGIQRATLDANGLLGLGTTPLARLHVMSSGSAFTVTNLSDLSGSMRLTGTQASLCRDGLTWSSGSGGGAGLVFLRGAGFDTAVELYTNSGGTTTPGAMRLVFLADSNGKLSDKDGLELGYKVIPPNVSFSDGASLTVAARGQCVAGAYTALTVPNGVFARGDSFMVYQDSAASMTLTQGSGVTMRLAGSATTGSRTLAGRGLATVWFNSASECIVSGAGVS